MSEHRKGKLALTSYRYGTLILKITLKWMTAPSFSENLSKLHKVA